jgi:hypothetical protein
MAYWRKRELFIDIAFRAAAITEPPKAVTPPAKKHPPKMAGSALRKTVPSFPYGLNLYPDP